MSEYARRPRAEQDLAEHFAYIARDKRPPAERFLKVAQQTFEELAAMPRSGRAWQSKHPRLQDIRLAPMRSPYRSYLVFYRVTATRSVEILAVLHSVRDISAMVEELL